ncbi:hypothetical protein H4582DRAFT_2020489 [Lactarius indigo]|nr:hypothetical protein H4582DRAFT_2020489 [Lactarius indigo]
MLPWPSLNRIMDLAEILNPNARAISETRKRLLKLGDDATVQQIGNGKDTISLLIHANAGASEDDRVREEIVARVLEEARIAAIEALRITRGIDDTVKDVGEEVESLNVEVRD